MQLEHPYTIQTILIMSDPLIKQLSNRLQSGWKLTNTYCRIDSCNTVLIQDNRDDKKIWCLKCNIYYKTATDNTDSQLPSNDIVSTSNHIINHKSETLYEILSKSFDKNNNDNINATGTIDNKTNNTTDYPQRKTKRTSERSELGDSDSSFEFISPTHTNNTLLQLNDNPMYDQIRQEMLQQYTTSSTVDDRTQPDSTNYSNEGTVTQTQPSSSQHELRMNNISSLLGQHMLQGWTLLGDTCTKCNCPLMRKISQLYCVACDQTIDNNTTNSNGKDDETQSTVVEANTTDISSIDDHAPVYNMAAAMNKRMSSLTGSAQSPPQHNRQLSRLPERISPNHLTLNNSTIDDTSHHTNDDDNDDLMYDDDLFIPSTDTQSYLQRSSEISSKLGSKMLDGWTLLDIHCPSESCYCPLVKSKQGIMLCVSCDSQVITPDQYDPSKHTITNTTGNTVPKTDISTSNIPTPDNTTIATTDTISTPSTINTTNKRSSSAQPLLSSATRTALETGSLRNRLRGPSALPPVAMTRTIDSTSTPLNTPNTINKYTGQLTHTLCVSRSNSLVQDSIFNNNQLNTIPSTLQSRHDSSNTPLAPPATPLDTTQRPPSLMKLPFATTINNHIINAPLTANSSPSVVAKQINDNQASINTLSTADTSTQQGMNTMYTNVTTSDDHKLMLQSTMNNLIHKIHSIGYELSQCTSLDQTCAISDTITKLAQAIKSVQSIQQ